MRTPLAVLCLLTGLSALLLGTWQWQRARELTAAAPSLIDIRFTQFMAQHHEQALVIAQALADAPPQGAGLLARGVHNQQLLELGTLHGWLRLWGQPAIAPSKSMDWMLLAETPPDAELRQYLLDCRNAAGGMVGLASPQELQALRTAEGLEREKQFLLLMRRHHEGGLPMARFAANHASLPAVRELASRIVLEQSEELMSLRALQARLDATGG